MENVRTHADLRYGHRKYFWSVVGMVFNNNEKHLQ
jgi:hypothetical protein